MDAGADQEFEEIFTAYFSACIAVHNQYIHSAEMHRDLLPLRLAAAVYVDVMDLSGLAIIFSELDDNSLFDIVLKCWDDAFAQAKEPTRLLKALYTTIEADSESLFSNRSYQRLRWADQLKRAFAARGVHIDEQERSPWPTQDREPHTSPIIESFASPVSHLLYHPHHYFAALYLARRVESHGVELPHAIQRCKKAMELATKRRQTYEENQDGGHP